MMRRAASVIGLLLAWISYGLVMLSLADNEASRCHQFGDLAAECAAPFMLFFAGVSLVFLLATLTLGVLAWRRPSTSESS